MLTEDTGDITPDSLLGTIAMIVWIVAGLFFAAIVLTAIIRNARRHHEQMIILQQEAVDARIRRIVQPVFNQDEDVEDEIDGWLR